MIQTFVRRTRLPAHPIEVFAWHEQPGAFERLSPPWQPTEVLRRSGTIRSGDWVELRSKAGPIWTYWRVVHRDYEPGRQFRDVMERGPFAKWEHTHRVEPDGAEACWLEDRVDYVLPGGTLGRLAGGALARQTLERVFAYRHRVMQDDFAAPLDRARQRVLVSGANGLIGGRVFPLLTTRGYEVARLTRGAATGGIAWDPTASRLDPRPLEGFDAVVHLAGENIAGRWTTEKKRRIESSRVQATETLCRALAGLANPPGVFVCASAIGYYGQRGEELLDESSPAGSGFLSRVCKQWEAACEPLRRAGTRIVHLRFGLVLSPRGGALSRMLPAFACGLGGRLGDGRQQISWIAEDDAADIVRFALEQNALTGPVNAVSPQPVSNAEFTRALGRVLRRPTLLPAPATAVRLAFGEMGRTLLLGSTRVAPRRLIESGYRFRFPRLDGALQHLLGRDPAETP